MGRAVPVCTNDHCRAVFADSGLTYKDITSGDILTLVMLLNREIKKSNKAGETSVNTMRLHDRIKAKYNEDGSLVHCFLTMDSHYFKERECISFNRDGFIGFAGWADDGNSNPIRRAFLAWVDELKKQKAGE